MKFVFQVRLSFFTDFQIDTYKEKRTTLTDKKIEKDPLLLFRKLHKKRGNWQVCPVGQVVPLFFL